MKWLFKEEPDHYSYDELARDRKTVWSGVRNPLAQKHLRSVRRGDLVFYYHTGKEKAVVGIAKAVSNPYPDPEEPSSSLVAVEVAPVRKLARPVPLATIKATRSLAALPLVRLPRLSVMPVSDREWAEIEKLSEGPLKGSR
jgi:predicted RNA-binding protein with PUA-like domain